MSSRSPSPVFVRLVGLWKSLALRTDVDDVILELLGRFSLEKLYAESCDAQTYQRVVITLLVQLKAVFYFQRLTLPSEGVHVGPYLGLLASWDVTTRCVEQVLHTLIEGRDSLWGCHHLRDHYLADFLLSSLGFLALYPRHVANQKAAVRRERFNRIRKSLEQVFDNYAKEKSTLLLVCREIANKLCTADSTMLSKPGGLTARLPNVTRDLYPLESWLSLQDIPEVCSPGHEPSHAPDGWLVGLLALRDITQFIVAASVQYDAKQEARHIDLRGPSTEYRDAILGTLGNLQIPQHLSRLELVESFNATFRIIIPGTLDTSADSNLDELGLDALDNLEAKLDSRRAVHSIHEKNLSSSETPPPKLFVVDCDACHLVGEAEIQSMGLYASKIHEGTGRRLPPDTRCPFCGEGIGKVVRLSVQHQALEGWKSSDISLEAVAVERHQPTQFQMQPRRSAIESAMYEAHEPFKLQLPSNPAPTPESLPFSPLSPQSSQLTPVRSDRVNSDATSYEENPPQSRSPRTGYFNSGASPTPPSKENVEPPRDRPSRRGSEAQIDKQPKSKWRLPFLAPKKAGAGAGSSADLSSMSSDGLEHQILDEMDLGRWGGGTKPKNRASRTIHSHISQSSTLALFWTQYMVQVWDVGVSPPRMSRRIATESTCILAAVAKTRIAYVIGTRDQRLTLRIIDLQQPSASVVEYRMAASPWCKSIAIDRSENFVVLGFEESVVRFFKTAHVEQPREDRLQASPWGSSRLFSVDTLSFTHDGLALIASSRNPKSGTIQLYIWRFPFITFHELTSCRHQVPVHESEDNGISAAILQSSRESDENLVCITTWTQSGAPVLIQPRGGHKTIIKSEGSGRIGNRIQCAAFAPSGQELAIVNEKGHLYLLSHINSDASEVRRLATSKELATKSPSFDVQFMTVGDEEAIVLVWADPIKSLGWVKRIPVSSHHRASMPNTPGTFFDVVSSPAQTASFQDVDKKLIPREPVELSSEHVVRELEATEIRPAAGFKVLEGIIGESSVNQDNYGYEKA